MLDGVLLVSRKTYSFAKMAPVVEWQEFPCTIESVHMPKDIDVRHVEADLKDIALEKAFPELSIHWNEENKLMIDARHGFARTSPWAKYGMSDIAVFIPEAKVAIALEGCRAAKHKMFKADDMQSAEAMLV